MMMRVIPVLRMMMTFVMKIRKAVGEFPATSMTCSK